MDEFAGDGVVGVGHPLLRVELKDVLAVHVLHDALGAAEAADSGAVLLEVEVVAVAVGTYASGTLVVLVDDAVGGDQGAVSHLLGGLGQLSADAVGLGDGLVVHDDVQGPGEALVVDQGPLGGQGLGGEVALDAGGPVGAADAHVGHDLLLQILGINGLAALLGDFLGDHHVAPVQTGTKAIHHRVEDARGALFKDGHCPDDAVGIVHLVHQPLEVVLQHAGVAPAGEQAYDAGLAAGAVLDVQLVEIDEFHLRAHFLGAHESFLAHGVVAAAVGSGGNTENFHDMYLPKQIFQLVIFLTISVYRRLLRL